MESVDVQIARLVEMVSNGQRAMADYHASNTMRLEDIKADQREIKAEQKKTNGRLGNAEKAIAVLKFAVFTIGGALLLAALQLGVAKLSGQ